MKKIYISIIVASLLCLQACNDFLNLTPKSIQVVSTVEDYRDILASYMRLLNTVDPNQQPVMGSNFQYPTFGIATVFEYATGEVDFNKINTESIYDPENSQYKTFAADQLTWLQATMQNHMWSTYFEFLGAINNIIGGIETAPGEDEHMRDYVKGEALVWRAYAYFKLMQYYCPYADNKAGLPLHLKPYEDPANAKPVRETQTAVYKRILEDCQEVATLLERTPFQNWNCAYHPNFLYGMMASVYCYKALSGAAEKSDWENSIKYADLNMENRILRRDSAAYSAMFDVNNQIFYKDDEFYFRLVDGENGQIFDCGGIYYFSGGETDWGSPFPPADVLALFKDDDIRKSVIFYELRDQLRLDKYNYRERDLDQAGIILLFRLAESYLIKAEALCRLGKTEEARKVLDDFKSSRYANPQGSYTEQDLLQEILKERKIEFYCEQDMWWIDMKRTGVTMQREVNGAIHTLESNDFRYSFPIPKSEIRYNPNMFQNPGWENIYF